MATGYSTELSFGEDVRKPSVETVKKPDINLPKRFYGTVKVDALRLQRDIGQIADEVIQHFTRLVDSEVEIEISIEIQVNVLNGIPETVIRTVTENCRVLKFTSQEFEQQ